MDIRPVGPNHVHVAVAPMHKQVGPVHVTNAASQLPCHTIVTAAKNLLQHPPGRGSKVVVGRQQIPALARQSHDGGTPCEHSYARGGAARLVRCGAGYRLAMRVRACKMRMCRDKTPLAPGLVLNLRKGVQVDDTERGGIAGKRRRGPQTPAGTDRRRFTATDPSTPAPPTRLG